MAVYLVFISMFLFEVAIGEKLCNSIEGDKCNSEESNAHNITILTRTKDLPEIKDGEPCIPGKSYKMDCNRCHCTAAKNLVCTHMACVDWSNFINDKSGNLSPGAKKQRIRQMLDAGKALRKNKNLRTDDHSGDSNKPAARDSQSDLPELPRGKCFPGRIYKNKCRRCFCNNLGKSSCSSKKNGACKILDDGRRLPVLGPEDVRPPFKREELKKETLSLSSTSEKCEPGRTYKVSCNTCVCTERNNLICTKSLCLSFDDINRVEADERTGKKCTGKAVIRDNCIQCQCISNKLSCRRIPGCDTETRARLSKGMNETLKMKIDPTKDKCVPLAIYKDDCNHCYCQPDASLRCTQKTCLNYAQAKSLNDQLKKLQEEV